jgi:hypothetical protein
MERIDTATKAVDLFGSGKHGFTEGDPGTGTPPTHLSHDWFNAVQEELANFIEGQGITLVPGTYTQLLAALRAPVGSGANPAINATGGSTNGTGLVGTGGGTTGTGSRGVGANHTTGTAGTGVTGAGGTATTGAGGKGADFVGGATSAGTAAGGAGVTATGGVSFGGTGGAGGSFTGASGATGGVGVIGQGSLTAAGGSFTGGATGNGVNASGGGTSGHGVQGTGVGAGAFHGIVGIASSNASSRGGSFSTAASGAIGCYGGNTHAAAQSAGSGVFGEGTRCYGVTAQSDTSTPDRAALRIVPQDTKPAQQQKGDVFTHTGSGLPLASDGTEWCHGMYRIHHFSDVSGDTMAAPSASTTFQEGAADIGFVVPANVLRDESTIRFRAWGQIDFDGDVGGDVQIWIEGESTGAGTYTTLGLIWLDSGDAAISTTYDWVMDTVTDIDAAQYHGSTIGGFSAEATLANAASATFHRDSGSAVTLLASTINFRIRVLMTGADAGDSATLSGFDMWITA